MDTNMLGIERVCGGIPVIWTSPVEFLVLAYDVIEGKHTWEGALDTCRSLTLGGFSDWRLPTRDELYLLFEASLNNPNYGFGSGWYWSNAEFYTNNAWYQSFSDGHQSFGSKVIATKVRAVRTHKKVT